jgi:hypothetical protein
MKNFIVHILLLVALCVVCSRCKHEPQLDPNREQCGEATTIDEMMEWVYFKEGTYWVYEEQNTGLLDTLIVYFDYKGTSAAGNREFLYRMRSSLDGYTYEYWFNDGWSGECGLFPGCFCRAIECDKYIPGDVDGNPVFIFPLRVGNQLIQSGGGIVFGASRINARIDSLQWLNYTFLNTYEFVQDYSPQHEYDTAVYRICKNIGIIEKEIDAQNEHWRLIDYRIEQ